MRIQGLITAAVITFSFNVQAIEVGSVADSRFQDEAGWTLDGSEMTRTRAKLLNPLNFGADGTVPEAINITDLAGPITYTALSTFEVFFIGYFQDDEADAAFTGDELLAMQNWVSDGGTMVITCDTPEQDAVCEAFGPVPSDTNATPPVVPTVAGATRPPFDGPFGAPAELDMAGLRRYFDDTGGFMVLAEDQAGNPVVLEALFGDGRVVVFTDVDIISNDSLSEGADISNDNDQFLGNLFAYLAEEALETFFINPGLNGNWWDFTRSGEGAQLEVIINGEVFSVILTFYSYDTNNNQIFLIAIGTINGNMAELDVFITDGGLWGDDFDPGLVQETRFGTGLLSSGNCEAIRLTVEPNPDYQAQGFTAQEFDLGRLGVPASPCPLESRE
jgi:hypothetical protein